MGSLDIGGLPEGALVLVDSAPIIYIIEDHATLATRFEPLFRAHASGALRIAVSTIAIAEVLVGPLRSGNRALERRCNAVLLKWRSVPLSVEIAQSAARIHAATNLKLADAVQAASALAIGADALVTHDRDFSRVKDLRIIS